MFKSIGPMELAIILLIVLIVFGVGKLPQIGGALGKGISEFKKASRGETEEKDSATKTVASPTEKSIKS